MPTRRTRKGAGLPKKSNNARTRRRRARNRAKSANVLMNRNAFVSGALAPRLSPCSENYCRVLTTPFQGVAEGSACIPDAITLPSAKFKVTSRGVFVVGTSGVGFVAADPFCGVQSTGRVAGTITSNVVSMTVAGFASTDYRTPGVTGVSTDTGNSQYAMTFFTDPTINAQFRLVGSGLRARYSGTELNRGGRMVPFKTRSNTDVQDHTSMSDMMKDNYYHSIPIDRQWHQITYAPSRTSDISYVTFDDPTIILNPSRCMVILVDGCVSGTVFEYEWVGYYELIANQTNIPITSSHSDPQGFGAVLSALPTTLKSTASSMYSYVKQGALRILGTAMSGVASRVAYGVGNALLGPPGGYAAGAGVQMLTSGPHIEEVE